MSKIITAVGIAVLLVGIAGIIYTGGIVLNSITEGGMDDNFAIIEYVFVFVIVGGFITLLYGIVSSKETTNAT